MYVPDRIRGLECKGSVRSLRLPKKSFSGVKISYFPLKNDWILDPQFRGWKEMNRFAKRHVLETCTLLHVLLLCTRLLYKGFESGSYGLCTCGVNFGCDPKSSGA
ncbi:unnamed protein product [Allacma fusca]|uniref:Uncharacterized protein n=1 Tax=Allacma fusca TaxID=39272 RepID=A0A8J2NWH5_9HEXA|nr:unnamed protein product [Allacma fusca]